MSQDPPNCYKVLMLRDSPKRGLPPWRSGSFQRYNANLLIYTVSFEYTNNHLNCGVGPLPFREFFVGPGPRNSFLYTFIHYHLLGSYFCAIISFARCFFMGIGGDWIENVFGFGSIYNQSVTNILKNRLETNSNVRPLQSVFNNSDSKPCETRNAFQRRMRTHFSQTRFQIIIFCNVSVLFFSQQ